MEAKNSFGCWRPHFEFLIAISTKDTCKGKSASLVYKAKEQTKIKKWTIKCEYIDMNFKISLKGKIQI